MLEEFGVLIVYFYLLFTAIFIIREGFRRVLMRDFVKDVLFGYVWFVFLIGGFFFIVIFLGVIWL